MNGGNNKYSPCYLCRQNDFKKRSGTVRDNPSIYVMECVSCGLVFLSSFNHVIDGFYENSGMHESSVDAERWVRESLWDDERRFNYLKRLIVNKDILDFGCGAGGFLKLAKKVAARAVGIEPEMALKQHFLKEEIEVFASIDDAPDSFDVITLFHVLEHIPDPRTMLKRLSEKLRKGGQLIIEVPNADDALLNLYNCVPFSNFTYWSCHLFLFTPSTLSKLAEQADLKAHYIKQIQRYPLSNHLHWLSKGMPGGHMGWSFLDSPELHAAYEKQLACIGTCDTILGSFFKSDS